ncbi:hypothetical protein SFOMI_2189 [Sphingobium fuliginis]|nr:hypothetical protein SFOMI_2189 [Sphingobium fuliginis]
MALAPAARTRPIFELNRIYPPGGAVARRSIRHDVRSAFGALHYEYNLREAI